MKSLEDDSKNLLKWFLDNKIKVNNKKFYLKIGSTNIKTSACELR